MRTDEPLPGTPFPLAGPVNFRDLGGYGTRDGSLVRRGRLFRSDGLWALTTDDAAHLVDGLGLRTVLDLRSPMEAERYGPSLLEPAGLTVHRIAFLDENLRPDLPTDGEWTLDDLYLFLLRHAGERVASALAILARDELHPAVFHCTAGKDRTGVLAALVLGLLGVDDEDVADDYARTAAVMPEFTVRARAFLEDLGRETPAFSRHVYTAERRTMLATLEEIRSDFGSLEGWALANGTEPGALESLRATLLERA